MNSREPDFDSLVDALRSDLPSTRDERRVRKRLLAAGVGVGTTLVAPGATASGFVGASSFSAALLQKLGALSWTVKIGLAGVAATAALPAAVYLTSAEPKSPAVEVAHPYSPARSRSVPRSSAAAAFRVADPHVPVAAPAVASSEVHKPSSVAREPVSGLPDPADVDTGTLLGRSSSAAFPVDEDEVAREKSTLGEETVLVERALYALRHGDRDGALRALEEHARRFPAGLLARERDRALLRANAGDEPKGPTAPP